MRSAVGKKISSAIHAVATGRELRVSLGPELLESRLSRAGDGPLEARADELSELLVSKGWTTLEEGACTLNVGGTDEQRLCIPRSSRHAAARVSPATIVLDTRSGKS